MSDGSPRGKGAGPRGGIGLEQRPRPSCRAASESAPPPGGPAVLRGGCSTDGVSWGRDEGTRLSVGATASDGEVTMGHQAAETPRALGAGLVGRSTGTEDKVGFGVHGGEPP